MIGAGVAGLGTAALLVKRGYEVTVLEKNKEIGGRGRMWIKDGYKFDMGPSWYMMPEIFEQYLAKFGKKVSDYYQLKRLPINYKVFFENGKRLEIKSKLTANKKLFSEEEDGGGEKLERYLKSSGKIYEGAIKDLVYMDYENWIELIQPKLLPYLFEAKFFETFHQYVTGIFKNKNLQKILEFTTVFLGGSPYNTPAFYRLISYTDFVGGIWYPMGGMHEIFEMLYKLAREQGVKIQTEEEVIKIEVENGKATGVKTKKGCYEAEVVVSGADYWWTETKLLEKQWQSKKKSFWEKAVMSPSALVIYLGLSGRLKNLDHHNLYFSDDWEMGFEEVYSKKSWPKNPSYYVHVPSVTDRSVAPKNGETMMILVPVAPFLDDSKREKITEKTIAHLEKISGEEIASKIRVKRVFSHRDFEADYHAYGGAAFGLAHTLGQTAMFRPRNRSRKVKNLYYAGQYTNPGVGVPTGLISTMIVDKLIAKREK